MQTSPIPSTSVLRYEFLGLLAVLCMAFAAGCSSATPSERLHRLYKQREVDATKPAKGGTKKAIEARAAKARKIVDDGELESAQDYLRAALLLYDSHVIDDVSEARDLALHAVEMGDDRGLPIAAEAEDVELMLRGGLQRYGTQYVFDAPTGRWSLYPVDPKTTDEERAAMGVVSLREARHREAVLNETLPPKRAAKH